MIIDRIKGVINNMVLAKFKKMQLLRKYGHEDNFPKFTTHRFTSPLYIQCANMLIDNGFEQSSQYCFIRPTKYYGKRIFCLYHFYSDGLTLNIYYPQEATKVIKSKNDMQEQIDRFKNE